MADDARPTDADLQRQTDRAAFDVMAAHGLQDANAIARACGQFNHTLQDALHAEAVTLDSLQGWPRFAYPKCNLPVKTLRRR